MKNSHIEWTDHTFNPWEGCTKVSPGCAHCYAEARNQRFVAGANWGPGAPRRRTSAANWKQPLRWDREAATAMHEHLISRQMESVAIDEPCRPRVFCASLADWLDDEVPIEWLADLLDLIRRTPNLDWLLLTKRPQNFRRRFEEVVQYIRRLDRTSIIHASIADDLAAWAMGIRIPENVWIGTTVEDQPRADERIPALLGIPARVRFLSCEPLLGPVDLVKSGGIWSDMNGDIRREHQQPGKHVNWVICGGESGKDARPMHPHWARSLRDQCAAAGVSFFFKQWGEHSPDPGYRAAGEHFLVSSGQQHAAAEMTRVGKKAAGRLLDGVEHSAFPEVSRA